MESTLRELIKNGIEQADKLEEVADYIKNLEQRFSAMEDTCRLAESIASVHVYAIREMLRLNKRLVAVEADLKRRQQGIDDALVAISHGDSGQAAKSLLPLASKASESEYGEVS